MRFDEYRNLDGVALSGVRREQSNGASGTRTALSGTDQTEEIETMKAKTRTEAAAVWMPIGNLEPWSENPRTNELAIPHVAKSIERFGFASPIIARPIEDGRFEIVAGHTRHLAAISLGLDRVPVRVMNLDPVDAKMLAVADNRIAELAEWSEGLEDVLRELDGLGMDLSVLGWGDELPEFEELPDYSVLDDDDDELNELADGVRKGILVEFEIGDYERAHEMMTEIRRRGEYVGGIVLAALTASSKG